MLTNRTTRGVVHRPVRPPVQPQKLAMVEVYLMEAPFIDLSRVADYYHVGCVFADGIDVEDALTEYQARQLEIHAAYSGAPGALELAQQNFASKCLVVEIPAAFGDVESAGVVYSGGVFVTPDRVSMNRRKLGQANGPTYHDPTAQEFYQEVITPPYLDYPRIKTMTLSGVGGNAINGLVQRLWVADPTGGFKRTWDTRWIDMNIEARHWLNRAVAENNFTAKDGASLYPVGGHATPTTSWPD
jgi:hypothetical protein